MTCSPDRGKLQRRYKSVACLSSNRRQQHASGSSGLLLADDSHCCSTTVLMDLLVEVPLQREDGGTLQVSIMQLCLH